MKLTYLLVPLLISSTTLHSTILREPPEGCPAISEINTYKSQILSSHKSEDIQLGGQHYKMVYLTHSKPTPSMRAFTNAIINPDLSHRAKCDYALRDPRHGMFTYYFGLEPVN